MKQTEYRRIVDHIYKHSKNDMNDNQKLSKKIVERKDLGALSEFMSVFNHFSRYAKAQAIYECAKMQWLEPLQQMINSECTSYRDFYLGECMKDALKSIQDQKDAETMILEKNEKDMYLFFISSEITVFTKNIIIEKIAKAKWKEILEKLSKEKPCYGNSYESGYTPQGTMWHHTIELAKQALKKI